jgi:uncharacterized short protein YbdD (DUF466 family)
MPVHPHTSNIRATVILLRIWRGIREWCGDAAYERYLESQGRHLCGGAAVLTREEFYLSQLQKKYSRVSRCC